MRIHKFLVAGFRGILLVASKEPRLAKKTTEIAVLLVGEYIALL